MMKILYEDNHIIVVEKPVNIPVQADRSDDLDLLTMIKNYIKVKYQKPGKVYIGLVHRLDRPVSGVMVFARTSKAAERLSKQIQNHTFKKKYYAVIEGSPLKREAILTDILWKDTRNNTVYVDERGKEAILSYQIMDRKKDLTLVKIDLQTGRSHQIRVQFSSRECPLYGDQRYNKNARKGQQIALFAKEISFKHPITQENLTFSLPLPKRNPFTLFL